MPATPGLTREDDVALVLHTSGTMGRPDRVPLTHKNLAASAGRIRETLGLTADDRCLNVMPLFHIHGLIGEVLASVAAGAGVVCTRGFEASQFFEWLEDFQATWLTAVPSIPRFSYDNPPNGRDTIAEGGVGVIPVPATT